MGECDNFMSKTWSCFIRSSGQYVNVYRRFIVIALYYSLYFISIMSLFFALLYGWFFLAYCRGFLVT